MTQIYHNPRCRKSRETLAILESKNESIEVVEYLKDSPNETALKKITDLLGIAPLDLIRKGERIYKENFKGKDFTHDEWIKIMSENPILIERPIVIKGNKAIIGRPPEKVLDIL